jgi:hypothetical protein
MHNILTIDVDSECSAELIEAGVQAKTEAAAICEEREEIDQALARLRDSAAEDFSASEAVGLRDGYRASLIRELRLRQSNSKLDVDHRRELAKLLDRRALPDLQVARSAIGKALVQIGFPPAADGGEVDRVKILVGKLVDVHPRVTAASGRVEELRQRSQSRDFAQSSETAIKSLQLRIKSHQEVLSRV